MSRYQSNPLPDDQLPLSLLGIVAMVTLVACEAGFIAGLFMLADSWHWWQVPVACALVGWLSFEVLCLPMAYRDNEGAGSDDDEGKGK